jgi:hypothetical protein
MKFIIHTNKGYICEKNASGYYENSSNEFYRVETGKWFTSVCSGCDTVDKLGFSKIEEEATIYCSSIGNRVNEIVNRIKLGYEDITTITIKVINE